MTLIHRLAAAALVLLVAACAKEPPKQAFVPTFYADLGQPGAEVDQLKAVQMINGYRARFGIAPLRLDPELSRIAAAYAQQMAEADKMSHTLNAESKIGPRLKANGYAFDAAGENIAAGYRTLAEAFSGWRESPAHDRGMKDPEMTAMGIGIAQNPRSKYKVFWCLILARPKGEPMPTSTPGVVPVPPAAAPVPKPG